MKGLDTTGMLQAAAEGKIRTLVLLAPTRSPTSRTVILLLKRYNVRNSYILDTFRPQRRQTHLSQRLMENRAVPPLI